MVNNNDRPTRARRSRSLQHDETLHAAVLYSSIQWRTQDFSMGGLENKNQSVVSG